MDPWKIIGWIILCGVGMLVLLWLAYIAACLRLRFYRYILHLKTRNIPPAAGQRWWQNGSILEIERQYDNGIFAIKTGNGSWGENA